MSSWTPSFPLQFPSLFLSCLTLKPKQCLHNLSQSSPENSRMFCILQICISMPLSHIQPTALPLCTSPLRTGSVMNPHLEETGTFLWTNVVAFFSCAPGPSQHGKTGCTASHGAEGTEKAMLQFGVEGRRCRKEVWSVSLHNGSRPISYQGGATGLNQKYTVTAPYLHNGPPQQYHTSD